jgi:hypothetical protein
MGYGCPSQTSVHPLYAELELPARIYSYEIQWRLVKAAVQGPFDEALGLLWDTTRVGVSKRSAEQIITEAAVDFDSFYAQRTDADGEQAEGPILVGAIDCKGIPMVKAEPATKVVRRRAGQKPNKRRRWQPSPQCSALPHAHAHAPPPLSSTASSPRNPPTPTIAASGPPTSGCGLL